MYIRMGPMMCTQTQTVITCARVDCARVIVPLIIDSGASAHISSISILFSNLKSRIVLADGSFEPALGINGLHPTASMRLSSDLFVP